VALLYLWPIAYLARRTDGAARALERGAGAAEGLSRRIGYAAAWLTLALVGLQFVVVLLRYVFGIGSIALQESVLYLHASLFLLAGAYTLLVDGHVRVDMFYRTAKPKARAMVDFAGAYLFLLPFMLTAFVMSYPYVASSWAVHEGSRETSGIQGVYLLKTLILIFAAMMLIQGFALAARAALRLTGRADEGEHHGATI